MTCGAQHRSQSYLVQVIVWCILGSAYCMSLQTSWTHLHKISMHTSRSFVTRDDWKCWSLKRYTFYTSLCELTPDPGTRHTSSDHFDVSSFIINNVLHWTRASGQYSGIILCMCPANKRRRYIVTSALIGWAHTQNDPWAHDGMPVSTGVVIINSFPATFKRKFNQ